MEKWLTTFECPKSYKQIKRDLSAFDKIDMRKVAPEAIERFSDKGRHSICHYVIKDNKVVFRP